MSEIKKQMAGKEELGQPNEPKNKLDTTKKGFASEKLNELKPKPPKSPPPLPHLRMPAPETMEVGKTAPKKVEVKKTPPETPVKTEASAPPPLPNKTTDDVNIIQATEVSTKKTILKLADYLHRNKLLPDSIKKTEEAVVCIQTSMALGYRTFGEVCMAIRNMYVINNQVNLWGDLPLSLVRTSKLLEKFDEFFIDEEYKRICLENKNLKAAPFAAICLIKRKEVEEKEFHLTADDLEVSGGTRLKSGAWEFKKGKDKKVSATWKLYPKIHWKRRLRGAALYDIFPDVLQGRHIFEYHHHPGQEEENTRKEKRVEEFIQK